MNQLQILSHAQKLISEIQSHNEEYDLKEFISTHNNYFSDIPLQSLLTYSYNRFQITTQSDFIYLIGSYIFFNVFGYPVTWLEKRHFAEYCISEEWQFLFHKTLAVSEKLRFASLTELNEYLTILKHIS